jgi:hypothetical protein
MLSIIWEIKGLFPSERSAFGFVWVCGRNLVPFPAAGMIHRMIVTPQTKKMMSSSKSIGLFLVISF